MNLYDFIRVRDFEGTTEELDQHLQLGWRVLEIKKERFSGSPSEFKDHITYVIGWCPDLANLDIEEDEDENPLPDLEDNPPAR